VLSQSRRRSKKITEEVWKQVEVAIASGIGAREVARNMGIPEGTVLAHVKRKAITRQIQVAKAAAQAKRGPKDITPLESVAISIQKRAERHVERMAGVSERGLDALEAMEPNEIVENAREIELHDRWSRRNYGLDDQPPQNGPINFAFLCNQAALVFPAEPSAQQDSSH
jgi:hypothetical protein